MKTYRLYQNDFGTDLYVFIMEDEVTVKTVVFSESSMFVPVAFTEKDTTNLTPEEILGVDSLLRGQNLNKLADILVEEFV